jgi:hypothetical protein
VAAGSFTVPRNPVSTLVNSRGVKRLLDRFPRIYNSSMNKGFRQLGSSFFTQLGKQRLVPGIFQVKRKFNRKASKAERAGFTKRQFGQKDLERKGIRIHTKNPALVARELGATIRPRRGEFLFIRGEFKGRSKKVQRAQGAFLSRQVKTLGRVKFKKPIIAKKRIVRIPPKLGFFEFWRRFRPRRIEIFLAQSRDAIRRAARRLGSGSAA